MNEITKYVHNGIAVAFNGKDKISLTDLWKAANGKEMQKPKYWLRLPETINFINALSRKTKVIKSHLLTVKRGYDGGTWAHWQIWLAYAKYLSPELHMWANQVVKDRIEEEHTPELAISRGRERAIATWRRAGCSEEWIAQRLKSIDATKIDNTVLSEHGDNGMIFALCADAVNKEVIGQGAKKFKKSLNLPKYARTRDYLDEIQLAQIALANLVSSKYIKSNDVRGNLACANIHGDVARKISAAIK